MDGLSEIWIKKSTDNSGEFNDVAWPTSRQWSVLDDSEQVEIKAQTMCQWPWPWDKPEAIADQKRWPRLEIDESVQSDASVVCGAMTGTREVEWSNGRERAWL